MKHIFIIIMVAILCTGFSGCKGKSKSSSDGSFGKDASYALGMDLGSSLKNGNIYPNWNEFLKGMKDTLYGKEPRFTMEEAGKIFYEALDANKVRQETENKQAEIDFLEKNKKKTGIITTESGLQYSVLKPGDGPKPQANDIVQVHYKGTLIDGTEFDNSYSRGEPQEFALNDVVQGWAEGLQLMNVGSQYKLFIPSELGYGTEGRRPKIPPYSTLVFEVELLDILKNN